MENWDDDDTSNIVKPKTQEPAKVVKGRGFKRKCEPSNLLDKKPGHPCNNVDNDQLSQNSFKDSTNNNDNWDEEISPNNRLVKENENSGKTNSYISSQDDVWGDDDFDTNDKNQSNSNDSGWPDESNVKSGDDQVEDWSFGWGGNSNSESKSRSNSRYNNNSNSNSNSNNRSGGKKNGCFNCNEVGHIASKCPHPKKRSMTCHKCGDEGHMARDCNSQNQNKGKNNERNFYNQSESKNNSNSAPREFYQPPELNSNDSSLYDTISCGINFDKYDKLKIDLSGKSPPKPINSFRDLITSHTLLNVIKKCQFTTLTPVQKYSIPIILEKRDLMACAQTGSGKTLAYLLPILQSLFDMSDIPDARHSDVCEPFVLILSPTRELALQIRAEAFKFCANTILKCQIIYGGTDTRYQIRILQNDGAHILVATPGRLLDFIKRRIVGFRNLMYLVLDEADRMISDGFLENVQSVFTHSSMPPKSKRQTLMFSATFPSSVQNLANQFLSPDYLFLAVGLVGSANSDVKQCLLKVTKFEKRAKLTELLNSLESHDRTMIFVETKKTADFLASFLSQSNFRSTSIHGDRLQRQREEALRDLKSGKFPILVATSVAARGLDIKDVSLVINYDLPNQIDDYIHRIGRTGRVGNIGKATSFYDPEVDKHLASFLIKVLNDSSQTVPEWLEQEASNSGSLDFPESSKDIRNDSTQDYAEESWD